MSMSYDDYNESESGCQERRETGMDQADLDEVHDKRIGRVYRKRSGLTALVDLGAPVVEYVEE
jgi:hypothetical protein